MCSQIVIFTSSSGSTCESSSSLASRPLPDREAAVAGWPSVRLARSLGRVGVLGDRGGLLGLGLGGVDTLGLGLARPRPRRAPPEGARARAGGRRSDHRARRADRARASTSEAPRRRRSRCPGARRRSRRRRAGTRGRARRRSRRDRGRTRRRRPPAIAPVSTAARWTASSSPRASLRISAMSSARPSVRSASSMPLWARRSEAMRRSFPAYCPSFRSILGRSFGPMTTSATTITTMSSERLNPNTGTEGTTT